MAIMELDMSDSAKHAYAPALAGSPEAIGQKNENSRSMPKMVGHQRAIMNKARMLQAFQMRQKASADISNITITAKRDIPSTSHGDMYTHSTMPVMRDSSEMNTHSQNSSVPA